MVRLELIRRWRRVRRIIEGEVFVSLDHPTGNPVFQLFILFFLKVHPMLNKDISTHVKEEKDFPLAKNLFWRKWKCWFYRFLYFFMFRRNEIYWILYSTLWIKRLISESQSYDHNKCVSDQVTIFTFLFELITFSITF